MFDCRHLWKYGTSLQASNLGLVCNYAGCVEFSLVRCECQKHVHRPPRWQSYAVYLKLKCWDDSKTKEVVRNKALLPLVFSFNNSGFHQVNSSLFQLYVSSLGLCKVKLFVVHKIDRV
jgi:hypothetical protein